MLQDLKIIPTFGEYSSGIVILGFYIIKLESIIIMNKCHCGCEIALRSNEKIVCSLSKCKKSFHYECVQIPLANLKTQKNWKCPECTVQSLALQRSQGKDNTPIKPQCDLNTSEQNVNKKRGTAVAEYDMDEAIENEEDQAEGLFSSIPATLETELRLLIRKLLVEEFSSIRKEMRSFDESLKFFNNQFEEMKKTVSACTEDNKQLRKELDLMQCKVKDLESKVSVMEQDSRQSNIELQNLPEHRNENLVNTMLQLSRVVDYVLSENDIVACNRVQKQNQNSKAPRAVVCRLSNRLKRDNLLAAVIKYNRSHPKEKVNTKLLGYGDNEAPIYISEHLTPSNKSLHAATRIWARENKFKFVWVRNGKIFVRKDENHPAKMVSHVDTLETLVA